jgi:hypothetical protein
MPKPGDSIWFYIEPSGQVTKFTQLVNWRSLLGFPENHCSKIGLQNGQSVVFYSSADAHSYEDGENPTMTTLINHASQIKGLNGTWIGPGAVVPDELCLDVQPW